MFKIGDKAVYPAHGVGVVEGIENRQISGNTQIFYILRMLDNDTTIMIPQGSVESVGLRTVISRREIPAVFKVLRQKVPVSDSQTWNRRHREYMEKIRTGSVFEIAAVLRDLYLLKLDKELSFGERKVLDTARNLLVKELSIAQRIKPLKIEQEIEKIFHA
ncbi:MAG: CarD family transcriptional regulator [Deltaproteobacteria bacterium RBG_13_61_14]|nr:MAG: CarD family transcriptional regulator [Deltaproteobacteria bacterium RBG_13_61_14]